MRLLLSALSLCVLLPGAADAITIASHTGSTDPTTEGWTFNNGGDAMGTVGPVSNDGASMLDAWSTDDDGTDSNVSYAQDISASLGTLASGWTYQVSLRLADVPDPVDFGVSAQVETGSRAYAMIFGTNASGDVVVHLSSVGQVAVIAGGSSDYHLFEFVETDTSTSEVDFRIDGVKVTDYLGLSSSRTLVAFGDTSVTPGSGGQGNYASAILTAVPEPGVTMLLAGSLAGLVAWRTPKRRVRR